MYEYFNLSVQQAEYIIFGLAGGLVGLIAMLLTYMLLWRPRRLDEHGQPLPPMRGGRGVLWAMPWVLVLTYIAWLGYEVIYMIGMIKNPPTW